MIKNIELIIEAICLKKQIGEYYIELETNTVQHNLMLCLKNENPILIRQDVTGEIKCLQHKPISIEHINISFFITSTKDNDINL